MTGNHCPRPPSALLHPGTFLCVGFHCRCVVCACSAGAVGSFSNKPLSPKKKNIPAQRERRRGSPRAAADVRCRRWRPPCTPQELRLARKAMALVTRQLPCPAAQHSKAVSQRAAGGQTSRGTVDVTAARKACERLKSGSYRHSPGLTPPHSHPHHRLSHPCSPSPSPSLSTSPLPSPRPRPLH